MKPTETGVKLSRLAEAVKAGTMTREMALAIAEFSFPGVGDLASVFDTAMVRPDALALAQGFPVAAVWKSPPCEVYADAPYDAPPTSLGQIAASAVARLRNPSVPFHVSKQNRSLETPVLWDPEAKAKADARAAMRARLPVMQGKDAIGRLGVSRLDRAQAEAVADYCRAELLNSGRLRTYRWRCAASDAMRPAPARPRATRPRLAPVPHAILLGSVDHGDEVGAADAE